MENTKRTILAQFTDEELRIELGLRVNARKLKSGLIPRCRNCIHIGFGPCKRTGSHDTLVCLKRVKEVCDGKTYYYATDRTRKACDQHEYQEEYKYAIFQLNNR